MVLSLLLPALAAGALVYCVLTIVAAMRYRGVRPSKLREPAPVSILKPLAGVDDGLKKICALFEQDYPAFESSLQAPRRSGDRRGGWLRARLPAGPRG